MVIDGDKAVLVHADGRAAVTAANYNNHLLSTNCPKVFLFSAAWKSLMRTIEISREEAELLVCALYVYKKALKEEPQTDGVIRARQQVLNLILRLEGLVQGWPVGSA